jgi:hypothetical protein
MATTAPRSLVLPLPPVSPTDLPVVRAGTTYRFHVVDHTLLILRAVLEHDAVDLFGATV